VTFLAPLFLIGAAAAAIPIVLHLLKREPEARVKFAAMRLLRRGPVEHMQRRRLRELILLALRVAALVLLAIGFARPFFAARTASPSAGATIVLLDTSMSLAAPGRFERARELARDAIRRVPPGDLAGVVTFADEAIVAASPSLDRALALSAIDGASAGFGGTRYRSALHQAAELLDGRRGTIVLVSDLQESGWDAGDRAAIPESAQIVVADVGPMPPNLAVTAMRVANDRVIATIRNASPAPREARVHLRVDDVPAGDAAATIAANQSSDVALPPARGNAASVSVEDPDGVQGDNVRYLATEPAGRSAILVVTATGNLEREAFYVSHALAANTADGPAYRVAGASGAAISKWDRTRLAEQAAVLLLSTRGLERPGRQLLAEYLKEGGGILIAAGPLVDGEVAADAVGGGLTLAEPLEPVGAARNEDRRALAPSDLRHPLFEAFGAGVASLGLATFDRIADIRAASCQALARFTTGEPALLDCAPGEGRLLVLASDLDKQWNDFPRFATFVPFLHEAVRYLAGAGVHQSEYIIGRLPPGVPPKPGLTPTARPGGGSLRRMAVNVDPSESDPARLTPEEFQATVTRIKDAATVQGRVDDSRQEERQHLWQYVLGAMLALMVAESFVAARTA
jgi:hypothetical protein